MYVYVCFPYENLSGNSFFFKNKARRASQVNDTKCQLVYFFITTLFTGLHRLSILIFCTKNILLYFGKMLINVNNT